MRLTILAAALLFLTSLTGCGLTGSGCGSGGCGTGGCNSGSCGTGGCGAGGCGPGLHNSGKWMHSHGVCDCEFDDYCSSRSPWVRTSYNAIVPASSSPAPISEPIPAPAPSKLPEVNSKKL